MQDYPHTKMGTKRFQEKQNSQTIPVAVVSFMFWGPMDAMRGTGWITSGLSGTQQAVGQQRMSRILSLPLLIVWLSPSLMQE